jgi:hypothetical protein
VLVKNLQVRLIRPPIPIRHWPSRLGSRGGDYWVFAFAEAFRHVGRLSHFLMTCCSPLSLLSGEGYRNRRMAWSNPVT